MLPASTTTEQKRPNAINSSPAEIPTQNSSAERSTNALTPDCPSACDPGVLVLARPSAREDGTVWNQDEPERPRGTEREMSGETLGNAGTALQPQGRTTRVMRS